MKNSKCVVAMLLGLVFSSVGFADGGPASIPDAIDGCHGSYTSISCDAFESDYIVRVHCTDGSIRAASEPFPGTPEGQAQCHQLAASGGGQ